MGWRHGWRELSREQSQLDGSVPVKLPKGFLLPGCTAQVHNLSAVKQQLWGLEMAAPCVVGDQVQSAAPDGGVLGRVTSYIDTPDGEQGGLYNNVCCHLLHLRKERLGDALVHRRRGEGL